ncbi:MAG TPA: hypothetical protein VMB71_09895 [Acetobacteraceae bacterium]|nr:hypothetical protein [Acetobacteraceae bacterium]
MKDIADSQILYESCAINHGLNYLIMKRSSVFVFSVGGSFSIPNILTAQSIQTQEKYSLLTQPDGYIIGLYRMIHPNANSRTRTGHGLL